MTVFGLDRLTTSYWLLGLAQAAHSIEEMRMRLYDFFWIATGRLHEAFPAVAQVRMSAETFAILNMVFIAVLLGTVPAVRARAPFALGLAAVAATVEVLNGIGHTAGAIWFRGYVPGVVTAPTLFVTGALVWRELRRVGREAAS